MRYMFFVSNSSFEIVSAKNISYKQAILELADYCGTNTATFKKSITGFADDDIDGLTQLFNIFNPYGHSIEKVYVIQDIIWEQ